MNKIPATVLSVKNEDILNIVEFEFKKHKMSMMSLELENIHVKDKVILSAKSSSIGIAKDLQGQLSYSNILKGFIKSIQNGSLLSTLEIQVEDVVLSSIITKNSSLRMDLKVKDEVFCIIKASDLSILEKIS